MNKCVGHCILFLLFLLVCNLSVVSQSICQQPETFYCDGSTDLDVSIDCLTETFSYTIPANVYSWLQVRIDCKNVTSSEILGSEILGVYNAWGESKQYQFTIPNNSKTSEVFCMLEGCGNLQDDDDCFYKLPTNIVNCNDFIPGIVTINGETLTSLSPHYDANVSPMTITWPPLSQQNGGKYLLQYLIQINATQLSGNRKLNLSEIEEKTTNTSILFYNIKPFTLYAIQVFAELNNTITTSSDNTILQVTVPTVLQTQESVPSIPVNISFIVSFTNVSLMWDKPSSPNGIITKYKIVRTTANTTTTTTNSASITNTTTNTTLIDRTLTPGETYTFSISAYTSVGEGAAVNGTITAKTGVYPLVIPKVMEVRHKAMSVVISELSTKYGQLSYYFVIVINGRSQTTDIDNRSLYSYTNKKWRYFGYYVAAVYNATNDNTIVLVGDNSRTTYNDKIYFNGPLEEGAYYRILIRLFSATLNKENYSDSPLSNIARISKTSVSDSHTACIDSSQFTLSPFLLLMIVTVSIATKTMM